MIDDLIKDRDRLKAKEDELGKLLDKLTGRRGSSYAKASARLEQPQPKVSFWRTGNYGYGGPVKFHEFNAFEMRQLEKFILSQLEDVKALRKERDAQIEQIEELVKEATT